MLKVGLTGGIGAGKTTVSKIFETIGVPVFNADFEAKKIMNEDEKLKISLINIFGVEVYENGELNKSYLSNIVFSNKHKLEILNSLVHPLTITAANNWALKQNTKYVIKEAALLFESGSTIDLDFVIGVFSTKSLRTKRVMQRDNVSVEIVNARMNAQIDESIKQKLCDFVINNNETDLLINQVLTIHKKILTLKNKQHLM